MPLPPSRATRASRSASPAAPDAGMPPAAPAPAIIPTAGIAGYAVSPAQLAMLVVCVVSVYFVIGFYGKSVEGYRINQRAAVVRREIDQLQRDNRQLTEQVAYLSTDGYVETAARDKLNLVRPGDHSLVVLPAHVEVASVDPPAPLDSARRSPELGHLADWLAAFFGPR